ncbi:MAG: haloacid dehalogenase type II [Rhodobacteraceae bacterium]|nr:haloacid dehalogenase type II [Paracoccaceae bacterium]
MSVRLCVFDAYGTLLDVAAAAREAAAAPGGAALAGLWQGLAADWRAKQLAYTWLRAAMGAHADFWQVTQDALDWALEARGLAGDAALRDRLLALYRRLPAFAEVPAVLAALQARGHALAILSNGTPAMLAEALASAGIAGHLDAVLSVEAAGVFKPARAVYDLVGARFGTAPEEVLFVSANGWDAAAGAHYGFVTAWVNRAGEPPDRLPARPHHVLPDLSGLPDLAGAA